jgi:glycosyltransferase involved in cell wall biosynthesis
LALERADVPSVEPTVIEARPRLIYVITEDWYFWSHRLDLARAARDAGYEVTIATRVTDHGPRIVQEGFRLAPLTLSRQNRNLFHECLAVKELVALYRRIRPNVVHHVAIKPILYGTLAAWMARVPVIINAFAGLGYTFTNERSKMLRGLVRMALRGAMKGIHSIVLVQNRDDRALLVREGIVSDARIRLIAGSGLDLGRYSLAAAPSGVPLIALPARMLWDKGIREFVEAARMVKARFPEARFVLVGRRDDHNPAAIPQETLAEWVKEGTVEWWGHQDDMVKVYHAASIIVLPSYREGLPKVLLEAAGCGRALVSTDVPGCREICRDRVNGLLVPVRDVHALSAAMTWLLEHPSERTAMGRAGHDMVAREYSTQGIVRETLALYQDLLHESGITIPRHALA